MISYDKLDKKLIIFGSIFTISNRLQVLMDQTMDELTAKQWYVIAMLELFEEPPSLIQLANVCDSSYQNIKQIVLKLENKDFVKLEDNPDDRRAKRIVLTSKVNDWTNENRDASLNFVKDMFSGFTQEEVKEFSNLLIKLYDNLGAMKIKKEEEVK